MAVRDTLDALSPITLINLSELSRGYSRKPTFPRLRSWPAIAINRPSA